MLRQFAAAAFLLATFGICHLIHGQDRAAVPDREKQLQAVQRIKDVFPDEYESSKRDVKVALAKQLLQLGRAEKESVARFALFREAVRVAAENGDVTTAMQAIDAMEAGYAMNASAVTSYALSKLAKSVQGPESSDAFGAQCQSFRAPDD